MFQDTTKDAENEAAVVEFTCISRDCGKTCKSTDEGVNQFMRYCNACNILLTASLSSVMPQFNRSDDMQSEGHHDSISESQPDDWQDDQSDDNYQEDSTGNRHEDEPDNQLDDPLDNQLNDSPNSGTMTLADMSALLFSLLRSCDVTQVAVLQLGTSTILHNYHLDRLIYLVFRVHGPTISTDVRCDYVWTSIKKRFH